MTIFKSPIFIYEPVQNIISRAHGRKFHKIETANETFYLFGGSDLKAAAFGLTVDHDAPLGADWTQLMIPDGESLRAIANILKILKVRKSRIYSSTTWDGDPLVDIVRLSRYMTSNKQSAVTRLKDGLTLTVKLNGRKKLRRSVRRQSLAA